jgi:hypothetical protein
LQPLDGLVGKRGIDRGVAAIQDGVNGLPGKEMFNGHKGGNIPMDIRKKKNAHNLLSVVVELMEESLKVFV